MTDADACDLAVGRAAFERHQWKEALASLNAADARAPLRGEDLVRLAHAHFWTGSIDSYLDVMAQAFRAFVSAGDDAQAAWVALMLQWDYLSKPAKSLANGWYRRADRILETCPECLAHGYLAQTRMWDMLEAGNLDAALEQAREVTTIGTRLGNRDLEVLGLQRQAQVLVAHGDLTRGLALLDEAVVAALSGELGPMITAVIYCAAIVLSRELGDYERAAEWSGAAIQWCEREGCTGFPGLCRVYNAEIAARRGGWGHAKLELERACEELQKFGAMAMAAVGFYELGEIHRQIGALDEAREAYAQACEFGAEPEPGLSLLRLAEGDEVAAAASINRAVIAAGIEEQRCANLLACARLLPAQIEIALASGNIELARSATQRLEDVAPVAPSKLLQAQVHGARAALSLARGDLETALSDANCGRKLWQELDMPYESARARVLTAAVHGALGDSAAQEFELKLARTTFERLGVRRERIVVLLEPPARAQPPAEVDRLGLTVRELEILRLVARGLTDAEIATRLYLSPHTVHRHLANIRSKTRQPSRAAVVAQATRMGIL